MANNESCIRCGISLDIVDLYDKDEALCNECIGAEWEQEKKELNREYERSKF